MAVCKLVYVPVALFMALYFAIVNFLLIPFAYIKTVVHKFKLYKTEMKYKSSRIRSYISLLLNP